MPMPHLLSLIATAVFLATWIIPIAGFSTKCKQKCGKIDIIFPFYLKDAGLTDGNPVCGLRGYELECSRNKTLVAFGARQKYEVLDLRAGVLRINPLPSNSCSTNNLLSFHLYNTTYRLCSHNMLQLYNCNRTCRDCSIPLPGNYSVSLPSTCANSLPRCCENLEISFFNDSAAIQLDDFTGGYQSLENYSAYFNCSSFTSWAYSSTDGTLSFHADYGLKLEWFVQGNCSCSSNAICNSTYDNGYTCKCEPHYIGDGYEKGVGCRPASKGKWAVTPSRSPITNAVLTSGIVTAAFVLGVAMVFVAVLFKRRRDKPLLRRGIMATSFRNGDVNGLDVLLSGLEIFSYKQLDKATKGFASSEKLGNGACGAVYAAKLDGGSRVAVKRLHHFNTQLGYQQTLNELSVLCAVKHKNLVRLLGCCMDSMDPLLVFEYVSNGTLAEHLQRERGDGLDWFTRLTIAAETADALAYLHTMDPPILHRDVKSRNILLDHEYNTKVADFGLSRMGPSLSCDGSHISTIPQGTPGYLDPDYHQNFHLSDKSDVYSFGVVLIEIITALKPVDFSRQKKEVNLAALAVAKIGGGCLDDIIDPSLQANKRSNVKAMVQRVAELAFRCLAYDKDARPPMTEVLEELLLIRGSATAPVVDAPDDESEGTLWMDAHSSQQHESGFSLSSSESYLLAELQLSVASTQDNKGTSSENV
ncbi:hypothetical protein GOP47_0006719 [Adiantum capillus-veneris]|uniref:Protein kinase domain-containing protein n=1 Tax=Adiantum capillus-veneris TaxID=13818 RepID=A0A9D4V3L9_ADICA|nr:hypothetical protein GOP47_0006115 [Adiantum capillus-veneris]KAI5079048.1 hypothetical protein GOP47_0006719 [Adiantum capillus-veneris]